MRKLRLRDFPKVTELSHSRAKCQTRHMPSKFVVVLFVVYWNRILLCGPGWPRTLDLPVLAFWMLGLQTLSAFEAPPLAAIIPIWLDTISHCGLCLLYHSLLHWPFITLSKKGYAVPRGSQMSKITGKAWECRQYTTSYLPLPSFLSLSYLCILLASWQGAALIPKLPPSDLSSPYVSQPKVAGRTDDSWRDPG